MSSGQKVALSFLAALICFAGFAFFAQTNFLTKIETKFYAQSKIAQRQEQLDKLSNSCNSYISNILKKIETDSSSYLNSQAVKSYTSSNPSEKDEVDRRNLTNELFDTLEGLDGIRLIESNGRNVHFSTFEYDVLKNDGLTKTYKNYPDIKEEFGDLELESFMTDVNNPRHRIVLDEKENRLIISFPFFITEKTSFGSLVCYFNVYQFEQMLVNEGLLALGESFDLLVGEDGTSYGFVCGIPGDGKKEFSKAISNSWKLSSGKNIAKNGTPENLITQANGTNWVLFTSAENDPFNIGWVFKASVFQLPKELIYLIYVSVFITLFLIFFLGFSLKRDYLIKVKQRIKKVQLGIINEYLENKQQIEWNQIARQLEYRKDELSLEIKKSVGGKNKKYEKIIDSYLEQSWAEIINVINSQNNTQKSSLNGASIEEIRRVMEEVLQTAKLNVSVAATQVVHPVEIEEIEEVEEVPAVDDVETIEEIDEIEPAEDLAEIEEVDAVEDIDSVEEIESIETVEEIDEVSEIEEVEEIAEADETEEIEEIEEITEVEPADEVDEIETVESVDDVISDTESIEPIEDVSAIVADSAETVSDEIVAEEIQQIESEEISEEVEETEPIEPADEIESVETVEEEVESVDEIEPAEVVEDIESVEDIVEEVEEISDATEIEIPVAEEDVTDQFEDLIEVGDLEELDDLEELEDESVSLENSAITKAEPEFHYVESNRTFVSASSDEFATCDTIFAEDLCIGSQYISAKSELDPDFNFVVYIPDFTPVRDLDMELEDADEMIPSEEILFTMTSFAENDVPVSDLEEVDEVEAIVEEKGVYSIAENLDLPQIELNPEFKELVDSVLFR